MYFDDFKVSVVQGNIIEENHYYSFGLKIAGISSRKFADVYDGKLNNSYLYNGKELLDEDADLSWYDYGFRSYDPQIGRFMQLDPLTDSYPFLTPYQYASNDPITNIDIDGLEGGNAVKGVTEGLDAAGHMMETVYIIYTLTAVGKAANGKNLFKVIKSAAFIRIAIRGAAVLSNAGSTRAVSESACQQCPQMQMTKQMAPFIQAQDEFAEHFQEMHGDAKQAAKNGYVYVYVSNESNNSVYFDDLSISHERGPILEETHYYPFGLAMSGISSKAVAFGEPGNKYKYNDGNELQSNEFSDGSGLEMYDAVHRMYDPQLGRFGQIDPLARVTCRESPYSFAHNNPILFNDPLGLKAQSDSTRAPDGENVADKGKMEPVVVVALSKKFWVLQRFYYDMMDGLKRRKATIADIPQENVREMMYRFDAITKFRDKVDDQMYASDAIIWGIFLAPIVAVEGGFIIGEQFVSLTELGDLAEGLTEFVKDAQIRVYQIANTRYNQLVRAVLSKMSKFPINNVKDFQRFAQYMEAIEKGRDLSKDAKALKDFYNLLDKLSKLGK